MASDSQPAQQQRLFADRETKLYRALTSGKCIQDDRVTDFAFRLRPASADFRAETTLSVAITPDLAMGDLDCRGYTELLIGDIEKIEAFCPAERRGVR